MNKYRALLKKNVSAVIKCGHRSFIASANGVSLKVSLIVIAIMERYVFTPWSIVTAIYGSVYTASQLKC